MPRFLPMLGAAAAILACSPFAVQAQVVSGSAGIVDLGVRLIDLRPYDSTQPSFTTGTAGPSELTFFNKVDLSGVNASSPDNQDNTVTGIGNLTDATQLQSQASFGGGQSLVSKNGGNLTAQVSGDVSTFANVPFGFHDKSAREDATIYAAAMNTGWWTVSGNTEAIITGTLRMTAQADITGLSNDALLQSSGARAVTSSWGSMSLYAKRDGQDVDGVINGSYYFNLSDSITFSDTLSPPGTVAAEFGAVPLYERSFEIHVKNTSSQALDLYFTSYFSTEGRVYAILDPAPVPEPGTWALMALGLGLMAWRVRAARA